MNYSFKDVHNATGIKIDQYHTVLDYLNIEWRLEKSNKLILSEEQFNLVLGIIEKHGVGNTLCQWIKVQNSRRKYGLDSANQLIDKRRKSSESLKRKFEMGERFGFVNAPKEEHWNYKPPEQKRKEYEALQRQKYGDKWSSLSIPEKIYFTQKKKGILKTKNKVARKNILKRNLGYVIWCDTDWGDVDFLMSLIKNGHLKTVIMKSGYYLVSEKEIKQTRDQIEHMFCLYQGRNKKRVGTSYQEDELEQLLKESGLTFERHERHLISPKELDFYIADKKVALEFNGLYWHSTERVKDDYHLNKSIACNRKGVRLIHIFEDDWIRERDKIMSTVLGACSIFKRTVDSKECIFKEVSFESGKSFFDRNFLRNRNHRNARFFAIIYKDGIVSCAEVWKCKGKDHVIFCNSLNTNVVDSIKVFMINLPYTSLTMDLDRSIYGVDSFLELGWRLDKILRPRKYCFRYCMANKYRLSVPKSRLKKLMKTFDPSLSEQDNLKRNGYKEIYDCGCYRLIFRKV